MSFNMESEKNMTAVDIALQQRQSSDKPIRVGMVGAGATGRAIALQLGTPVPGMRLVGIANRTPVHAERAFREAGFPEWRRVESAREAEMIIDRGLPVLTDNPSVLTNCNAVDILLEVTGTVEAAAHVVLEAFEHGKHVVLVNAELDSLLGPILKRKADDAGVVVTHTDGDEPGVALTLLRYLRLLGLRPVAAGNIKAWSTTIEPLKHRSDSPGNMTRMSAKLLPLRTRPSYRWRRRSSRTPPGFMWDAGACTVHPAGMFASCRLYCRLNRCWQQGWLIIR